MKRFLLAVGIITGVGISIVIIQAASLLPNSSSAALKKITTPTTTKIDTSKTQTPTPLDKLKPAANPQSIPTSPKITDTKQDTSAASSKTLKTLTPAINTTPKDNTDILKPIDIPKPTINTPFEKIAPLSPETKPSIILPLKENTDSIQKLKDIVPIKEIPLMPGLEKVKEEKEKPSLEFLLTPPPKDSVLLPENILLTPKLPENTVILEKIISKENTGSEITLPLMSALFKDVSESNSSYQAIKNLVDLMKQQGNFILPASKKFRPRNKLRPSFAAQIAISLRGVSCGIGKAATRAKTCLAKAYELGLFEKNALADKPMTRGDFYDLLLAVLKIPAVESTEGLLCQDVDSSHAYAEIVATAKQYGIARRYRVKGEGGYCLPDAPLTKADAAVIASKALEAKQKLGGQ